MAFCKNDSDLVWFLVNQVPASGALVIRTAVLRLSIDSVITGAANFTHQGFFSSHNISFLFLFHFYKGGTCRDIYAREGGSDILQKHSWAVSRTRRERILTLRANS